MSGINLDAASVRAEVRERGTFTEKQVEAIEALSDEEIDTAIREEVGDYFWEAYDSTRSDAIRRLMEAHHLGDEGEDDDEHPYAEIESQETLRMHLVMEHGVSQEVATTLYDKGGHHLRTIHRVFHREPEEGD